MPSIKKRNKLSRAKRLSRSMSRLARKSPSKRRKSRAASPAKAAAAFNNLLKQLKSPRKRSRPIIYSSSLNQSDRNRIVASVAKSVEKVIQKKLSQPRRKSPKRKSPKRRSSKRRSSKRRKSPKRRSRLEQEYTKGVSNCLRVAAPAVRRYAAQQYGIKVRAPSKSDLCSAISRMSRRSKR